MKSFKGIYFGKLAALMLTSFVATQACAQAFPSKPIKIIAPFSPGGSVDLMARYICLSFTKSFGQECVVENKAGAGGIIGMSAMLAAPADGHTLAMMPSNLSIIPSLYNKVPYDTLKDVAPIALVSSTPLMIGTHPSVPAKSFQELISYIQQSKGKVSFTACGSASPQHLAGEMLGTIASLNWTHIPYKGCADAMVGVISGDIPVWFSNYTHFAPQIKAGKLKGFAMLGANRTSFAPEYPTVSESGFPGFEASVWYGLVGSSKIPASVISRLNEEVNKALNSPDMKEKLRQGEYEPIGGSTQKFGDVIKSDLVKFEAVIKKANIKVE
jgi:tripartite-type tricarboxylate transporter receptor subunit TctC